MSARKVREWAPKWADPGTALIWEDHQDRHVFGTVWSDGPVTGSRWVTLSDGSIALVKVGMSGRSAGEVRELVRHHPEWQRRMVRALDRLATARGLMCSDEEQEHPAETRTYEGGTYTMPAWTSKWTRYHIDGCEHAERAPRWDDLDWRNQDGTRTYCGPERGWHSWLLAHLAADVHRTPDLCHCITGEATELAATG